MELETKTGRRLLQAKAIGRPGRARNRKGLPSIPGNPSLNSYVTFMTLWATPVHENCVFVLERLFQLSRLSQFRHLRNITDFNDGLSFCRWEPPVASVEAGAAV
jgi:hypothetical protein